MHDNRIGDKVKILESGGTWGEIISISRLVALVSFKKDRFRIEKPFRHNQLFNVSAQAREKGRNKDGRFCKLDYKSALKVATGCWADLAYEHDWEVATYTHHNIYFKCNKCSAGLTRPKFEYDPDAEKLLKSRES